MMGERKEKRSRNRKRKKLYALYFAILKRPSKAWLCETICTLDVIQDAKKMCT
jgi:hypothetical protein